MTSDYHKALVYICTSNEMPIYFLYKEKDTGKAVSFFILLTTEDLVLEVKLIKRGQSC